MPRSESEKDAIDLEPPGRPNLKSGFRYPHQVSGGQLQRAIQQWHVLSPDLIIFDELTTALDVTTQIEVLQRLRYCEPFNTAAIYITHDLPWSRRWLTDYKSCCVVMRSRKPALARCSNHRKRIIRNRSGRCAASSVSRAAAKKTDVPVISLQNVTAACGKVPVLKDVSFDIHREPPWLLLVNQVPQVHGGTLYHGLLPPLSGQILNNGRFARRLPPAQQRSVAQIQMIYQMADTALNPR